MANHMIVAWCFECLTPLLSPDTGVHSSAHNHTYDNRNNNNNNNNHQQGISVPSIQLLQWFHLVAGKLKLTLPLLFHAHHHSHCIRIYICFLDILCLVQWDCTDLINRCELAALIGKCIWDWEYFVFCRRQQMPHHMKTKKRERICFASFSLSSRFFVVVFSLSLSRSLSFWV